MEIKGDFAWTRKRKTTTTTTTSTKKPTPKTCDDEDLTLLSLHRDVLVMIVARVPISYHPILSLVSKIFRSIVASPELYKVRSSLGLTETCLYVCLRFGFSSYKWYTLSSKSSSSGGGYVLARVSMPPDDHDDAPCNVGFPYSDLVAVGSDIYNIGVADSPNLPTPTSGVSILDCKTHTWRKAPDMPVEVEEIYARVLDRKIYVLERQWLHRDGSRKNWLQVFNTDTQTWDVPFSGVDSAGVTFILDGKLHAVTVYDGVFAFDSKKCGWDRFGKYQWMGSKMYPASYCEIDNVMYSVYDGGALRWYDPDNKWWRDLEGLVGLPKLPDPRTSHGLYVKLTGYGGGGKMMIFWNGQFGAQGDTIYCAEISLERSNGDCWGKLEWYGSVLSVPVGTQFVKVLDVTL